MDLPEVRGFSKFYIKVHNVWQTIWALVLNYVVDKVRQSAGFRSWSHKGFNSSLPTRLEYSADIGWAEAKMAATSRSFSVVTRELEGELRPAVMLFYLVLRALDTIEDDMAAPVKDRKRELELFYTHLREKSFNLQGFGQKKEEVDLLANFQKIVHCLGGLDPKYFTIIEAACREMGSGMAQFLDRPIATTEDLDTYSYYVAGLVGRGLSEMWVASGKQGPEIISEQFLAKSISFGRFLQKTNIIRDVREDVEDGRWFWPKEIWSKHVTREEDLLTPSCSSAGISCLNELVQDALEHVDDCLEYLRQIEDPVIFRFCALPQVMGIATLALCYNNQEIFLRGIKIPRNEAASIVTTVRRLADAVQLNEHYLGIIRAKQGTERSSAVQ